MTKERAIKILADAEKFFESIDAGELFSLDEEIEAFEMAIKALEQTRWISVSDRLPGKPDYYLVTLGDESSPDRDVDISAYFGNDWDWRPIDEILAWMPLPEPWKGDTDETE
jgi:hypothetical protein